MGEECLVRSDLRVDVRSACLDSNNYNSWCQYYMQEGHYSTTQGSGQIHYMEKCTTHPLHSTTLHQTILHYTAPNHPALHCTKPMGSFTCLRPPPDTNYSKDTRDVGGTRGLLSWIRWFYLPMHGCWPV